VRTKKVLQWRDREWSEVDFVWDIDDIDSFEEAAHKNGWHQLDELGNEHGGGLGVVIYERDASEDETKEPLFFAHYGTPHKCQKVLLPRWQDLIDFLAHVSPTMLASVLPSDTSSVLDEIFEKTDYRTRERRRWKEEAARKRAAAGE
jgi:hypothetical protein